MLPYRDSRFIRIMLGLFFVLVIGYAIFEAQGVLYGPEIQVPSEAVSTTEQLALIKGRAERITELRLNGKTISVTENGDFEEKHLLAPGSNHLILQARDARGRTTETTLIIIYTPPIGTVSTGTGTSSEALVE